MILITKHEKSGINPFFPIFVTSKYRNISVVEWTQYRKLAPYFFFINILLSAGFLFLLNQISEQKNHYIYSFFNIALPIYIFVRLRFGRRMIDIQTNLSIKTSVAPALVWIEYLTLGLTFVLMSSLGAINSESTLAYTCFTILRIFFSIYMFLPIINYVSYICKNKLTGT